ncbi:MAG: HAD hydrolase-like protein [Gemmatimonadota bacterium]|nr:MAG: HAD hydrolase-like protein [Gemmatimonadota bacterium]
MPLDHFATLRQSIPRMRHLVSQLEPTYRLETVAEINEAFLEQNGIRAVLWDVDGTLMPYHGKDVDPVFPHVRAMFRDGPARHAILSNCDEARFDELGHIFPEVPLLRAYSVPRETVFRFRLREIDTHTPEDIEHLLATGGKQIRKPSSELIRHGMDVLKETDPEAVLMVGDQYLTDIASANLAGVRSVKVETFRPDTFPRTLRVSQLLESLVYRLFGAKGGG